MLIICFYFAILFRVLLDFEQEFEDFNFSDFLIEDERCEWFAICYLVNYDKEEAETPEENTFVKPSIPR
jgi:hypothetical protein